MARKVERSAQSGRIVSSHAAVRHPRSTATQSTKSGRFVTVELKSRGKTVTVSPEAAKVLQAAEELRKSVSKDWK